MKKFLVAIVVLAGVTGTAHAADASSCSGRDACVKHVCTQLDSAGFCIPDASRVRAAPATTRVSLNDQGRMQLDRLIARLR